MANARKYNVGLVQMRMGADPEANFASAVSTSARRRGWARTSSACRSFSARSTSASARILRLFDLAEPIPGPSTARLAEVARESRVAIIASLFERARRGFITTRRSR
jgi:N-carbamoylputrescine amidase